MQQTIADYIMHDLDHKCKLDEVIEAHLDRTPVPRSVERRIKESRECPDNMSS
ncbi:MAG: hypothetical protein SVM79_06870 [Chloroflexota bacterium]|nr:hypothetical protein [Chloroflexota bacterium]